MKTLFVLLSVLLAFASFGANAQNTPWTYEEEEDGFGIKTYSLVVSGAKKGFDFRFALSMGCSIGKNHFFVQHSFTDPEYSYTREESLRRILKLSDRVYSMAKRSAETGEMVWRVDGKNAELASIEFAKFSDGLVGVASKHLPSFLRAIYGGKVMIIGYKDSIVHQFSLVGTEEKVAKFAKNCNIDIN